MLTQYYRSERDRASFVTTLFDGAARHYDWVGHLLAFGSGPYYRRRTLAHAGLRPPMKLLDVATGTGQVARAATRILGDPRGVVGLDPSVGMLREARRVHSGPLVQGRAEEIPLRDDVFDMLSMGFALRHVATLETAFAEYRRVLKPGGRLLLLEVSRPQSAVIRWAIRIYFQQVLPLIIRIGTGSRGCPATHEVLLGHDRRVRPARDDPRRLAADRFCRGPAPRGGRLPQRVHGGEAPAPAAPRHDSPPPRYLIASGVGSTPRKP